MANVPDNKKGWTLIKRAQELIAREESLDTAWQSLKDDYQSANPNINTPGFPLTAQEVSDASAMIAAHSTFLSDNATIITTLKNKNVGSHKGNALD